MDGWMDNVVMLS